MLSQGNDLRDNRRFGPFFPEYFCELLKILSSCLSNGENSVTKPPHTKIAKLLIEELHPELTGKKGNVFDYGKADSPLLVFSQLDNRWEQRLGEELNADNYYRQNSQVQ